MPRIDPDRLLKCLAPLLNPSTGAIRSAEEVDKIFGLMSKFSKKLVSKCIYINILKATTEDVVDRFMERGGWNLVFGWTNDAIAHKNYSLLQEIFSLLLRTPVTVARLKSNRFPVVVKNFSKDCEDETTKNVCKSLVTKWIAVARGEESSKTDLLQQQQLQVQPQVVQMQNSIGGDLPNLGNMNDHLLGIDPSSIPMLPDTDGGNPGLMDIDIANADFAGIDLNLDILDNMGQPLDDSLSVMGNDVNVMHNQPTSAPISVIQHAPSQHQLPPQIMQQQTHQMIYESHIPSQQQIIHQPQQHSIQILPSGIPTTSNVILANVNTMNHNNSGLGQQPIQIIQQQPPLQHQVSFMQPQPNLILKSVDVQHGVVQNSAPVSSNFNIIIRDGKHYLVRLKDPPVHAVNPPVVVQPAQPVPQQVVETPKVPPLVIKVDQTDSKKIKSPRKEPQVVSPVNKVPGDMKTYSKTKPGSSSSSSSSGSSKERKDKSKEHKSSSSSKSKSSESSHRHRKSKQESAANKAAEAAKQAKEDERLSEKIRREKAQMKKRQKEVEKQKQQTEKDQETLKKLNLVPSSSGSASATPNANSSPSSLKIPKIPKRPTSSFADAIGIPGSDGGSSVDKIKKISPDKSKDKEKEKVKEKEEGATAVSAKKFYGKKEEDEKADEKPKERRHKAKVFMSSRSRNDDLIDEMTDPKKTSKETKEKGKEKEKEEIKPTVGGTGNSILATPPKHVTKRLSTDTLEKPDAKKAKLDAGKDKKEAVKEPSVKEKIRKVMLTESSLFMNAIAGADGSKTVKKKRRTSSGDSKEPAVPVKPEEPMAVDEPVTQEETVKKPTMGFYCETLNDEEEDRKDGEEERKDGDNADDEQSGSFTPQENDGKVKSALVLVRSRNRPRKTVRWREEDELKEFHYFEMDETERVNVTKQKDFTALSANERQMEGSMLKTRPNEDEDGNKPWKLRRIQFAKEVLDPPVISTEIATQEEREKNVLGLFLPPGGILPDSADEPDSIPVLEKSEPRMIPVEDVIPITKVCDYRTHSWPEPKGMVGFGMGRGLGYMQSQQFPRNQSEVGGLRQGIGQFNPNPVPFPPQMVPHPQQSPTNVNVSPAQDYNPWNTSLGFNVPPPTVAPDIGAFGQFAAAPPPTLGMNIMGAAAIAPPQVPFTANPFAFPPPASTVMGQINGAHVPSSALLDFGQGNRSGNPARGGSRFDSGDRRNNFGRDRDNRDRSGSRDRDYRDDRSSRDRDHRRGNDRDYRNNHDRERNNDRNRDFRRDGSRNIRKEIPCRFFKKGHCSNGSRCEFLHESTSDSSRRRSSPPHSGNEDDWESPDPTTNLPDSAQSPPPEDRTVNPNHQPRTTSRFSDAPMSPTDESPSSPVGMFSTGGESTKVIPA